LLSPNGNGITSGGEHSIALDPGSSRAGSVVSDGAGFRASTTAAISAAVARGIARHRQHIAHGSSTCRASTMQGHAIGFSDIE
jgi:hypothetical protein